MLSKEDIKAIAEEVHKLNSVNERNEESMFADRLEQVIVNAMTDELLKHLPKTVKHSKSKYKRAFQNFLYEDPETNEAIQTLAAGMAEQIYDYVPGAESGEYQI